MLNECGYDTSQNIGAFLSANFSKTTWMNLLKVTYSEISLFDLIPLWRGNFHQGGKIGQVILAKDDLMNYFARFSPLPEQILNLQNLLFSMLRDKNLKDYLKEEGVITQLSQIIASLSIPRFNVSNAEKTIHIFVKLQEIAPSIIQKYSLSDWNGIYDYLSRHLLGDLSGCTNEEVRNALHFVDDLKKHCKCASCTKPLAHSTLAKLKRQAQNILYRHSKRVF